METIKNDEELTYSKKQLSPLIDKFGIKPESDTLFKRIITLFKDSTSYQVWAIKMVFNNYAHYETIQAYKEWADNNHQLVQKLSKGTLTAYNTPSLMERLGKEISALEKYLIVKRNVDKFNTDQRKAWSNYIGDTSDGWVCAANNRITELEALFKIFEKCPSWKQKNFITKMSAFRDGWKLAENLKNCVNEDYTWDREDLLAFVSVHTPSTDVVYDKDKVVILNIKDYESSRKTCGGNKTGWCITNNPSQFDNYVTSKNHKQYFMFNFGLEEQDDLSKIGFTVDAKDGITDAHAQRNGSLMPRNGYKGNDGHSWDIFKVMETFGVPYNIFMKIMESSMRYKWNKASFRKVFSETKGTIRYDKGNFIIVDVLNNTDFVTLMGHTFVGGSNFKFGTVESKVYLIFDFSKSFDDNEAIVSCGCLTDEYGTESLENSFNIYGMPIDRKDYFNRIGIKEEEFLVDISLEPELQLQKYADRMEVDKAIELIKSNPDLDVNFSFHGRTVLYTAIVQACVPIFKALVEHPRFDGMHARPNDDSPALQVIQGYIFASDNDAKTYKEMLDIIFESGKFDLTLKGVTNDTFLLTSILAPRADWISERLIKDLSVDVNCQNDMMETVLSSALSFGSKDMVELLMKRPDIIVRDIDKKIAQEKGYDLDALRKPDPSLFTNSQLDANVMMQKQPVSEPKNGDKVENDTEDKMVAESKPTKFNLTEKEKATIAKIKKLFL